MVGELDFSSVLSAVLYALCASLLLLWNQRQRKFWNLDAGNLGF
ncbi:hypothetical protein NC653_017601 [Populus alba x Populus x berolinensis]|uniref:Uncharacterized protein n=1 Tax=Populus alba x Populus x berolinensis TaxID=444605 RepID=A0AAD6QQP0_9ROSI|nr:hypothetical protein NC653_017601 [Populus alba x Populus x berolinensis]